MGWNYGSDPSGSNLDAVRLLIGDTDFNDQLLQDEEINFFIAQEGSINGAASRSCEAIAAKFSRLCDEKLGQASVTYSQKSEQYMLLAEQFRDRDEVSLVCPVAPSISVDDKRTQELDDDRVTPSFTTHKHRNPYASDVYEESTDKDDIGRSDI